MALPYLYQEVDRIYAKTIGRGVRSLCITSSIPAEGTTSVVCALAQRAKAVNLNVLIVDLNLHNPFVTNMIDPCLLINEQSQNNQSLLTDSELVVNDKQQKDAPPEDWDTAISHLSHQVNIADGPEVNIIPNPCDKDNSVKFREHANLNRMIAYWQQAHDCIIFDTSPLCLVNQKNIPAQHVATCCDAAVLVVKSGKTQVHQIKEAMDILHTVEVNLVGTVMNDFENPLLGVELIRQCQKLSKRMPRVSNWLTQKIKRNGFLFADF